MTSRVGLVWWIVLIAVIGLLVSGAGDVLVPDRCRDECKERADRRFGPGWSPWKHIYESGCQLGCWAGEALPNPSVTRPGAHPRLISRTPPERRPDRSSPDSPRTPACR